jgi:flagellar P-ring protein precursor FlgI
VAFAVALLTALLAGPSAQAGRVRDLCKVQGADDNPLYGVGLVVGLAGTGDKSLETTVAQQQVLKRLNVELQSYTELKPGNAALVSVTATLPPFSKQGTKIDVVISSMADAKSLEGGVLLPTILYGINEQPYATAQGAISIGGFNAGASGSSIRKNHVSVGRIPQGGTVEREVPSTITDGERICLLLHQPDFETANNIQTAINKSIGPGSAAALGAGTINVKVPAGTELVSFIARLNELDVKVGYPAKVVLNERTGTIVVGGEVIVRPCQVAHGNLSIGVSTQPVVSQPAPFSQGGQTAVVPQSQITASEDEAFLMPIQGASAGEIAEALNKLKVTPRDMIAVFQALRAAGAIDADLEIM